MGKIETLLAELIALPSVNPAFLAGNPEFSGEGRIAEFIAAESGRAGLDHEWQRVLPGRRNVLVRLTPSGRRRHRVILAPHLDTVGGRELPGNHFKAKRRGGKLHGRGACDTKGSIAVMLGAMFELAKGGKRPRETEILFAGLVDEENGQEGSRALAASSIKADLAIVGEPTRGRVVTAHKGDLWLKLITRGRAAHGARPELGSNAVHKMARAVIALEEDYAASLAKQAHPLLGPGTINVGAIRGGLQPNIVPDHCEILVDRRTLPGEKDRGVEKEILQAIQRAGVKAELENSKAKPAPPLQTDPDLPLVRSFMQAARQKKPAGVDFFCDAAILAGGGIPSVVFGPGDIAQAHTEDEWIEVAELEKAARILRDFLSRLP